MMEKSSFLKTKHTPTRHLVAGTTQQLFSLWYLIQFCLAIFLHYLVGSQILDWFSCFLGVFTEKDCFRSICDIILSPYQALLWPSLLWTAPAKSESAIIMVEKEQGQLGAWPCCWPGQRLPLPLHMCHTQRKEQNQIRALPCLLPEWEVRAISEVPFKAHRPHKLPSKGKTAITSQRHPTPSGPLSNTSGTPPTPS